MFHFKLKYIRTKDNEIIVFRETLVHKDFSKFEPVSAGFCHMNSTDRKVVCYGESVSLRLKSLPEDSDLATHQFFPE
jgi:hypothetical protein